VQSNAGPNDERDPMPVETTSAMRPRRSESNRTGSVGDQVRRQIVSALYRLRLMLVTARQPGSGIFPRRIYRA
jgi:hypothetical protein